MANEAKKENKQEVKKVETTQVLSPFEEMERMLDNYFSKGWMRQFHADWPHFPITHDFVTGVTAGLR